MVVAAVCAANMRAPLRSTPLFSDRLPGSIPGLSARNTIGRWNESATVMKCAALSAAWASIEPASTFGWLATTATGWPPRWASAQMIAGPNFGCTSNQSGLSNTTSSTARMSYTRRLPRGTMSSSSGVGRTCDVSSAGSDDGYDQALEGKYDRERRESSSPPSSAPSGVLENPPGHPPGG